MTVQLVTVLAEQSHAGRRIHLAGCGPGVEQQQVDPRAAVERVATLLALEPVGVGAAVEHVTAAAAEQLVLAAAAAQLVVAALEVGQRVVQVAGAGAAQSPERKSLPDSPTSRSWRRFPNRKSPPLPPNSCSPCRAASASVSSVGA